MTPSSSPPADVEAEAAALFADEPKKEEPVAVKTIDLNCPFCDEAIHFPADLAGKRAPCPECKRVIKVPELVKRDPTDWRKVEARGPTGARLPDQPALEGAWGSTTASTVGKQTLVQAGVIQETKPPRTLWQRVRWPVMGLSVVLVLGIGGLMFYRWWGQRAVKRALDEAIAFSNDASATPEAKGALLMGAGQYELNQHTPESLEKARRQLGKAGTDLQGAKPGNARDALLIELARARVELGGSPLEVDQGLRLKWEDVQTPLFTALRDIGDSEARLQAIRSLSQLLIERGQSAQVLPLTYKLFSAPDAEKAVALSIVGLELFRAGEQAEAESAADQALTIYKDNEKDREKDKEKPALPLRAEVVTLALLLQKTPPAAGKDAESDKAQDHLGKVEAAARQGKADQAREQAGGEQFGEEVQFRAQLALVAAAVDSKADNVGDLVDNALNTAKTKASGKPGLSWALLRLTELAIKANVSLERLQALPGCIADADLRGWAQLLLFRAQLAQANQVVEEEAADKIAAKTPARWLAAEALARHNTRLDSGWADKVKSWEQPLKAFGQLGVVLGLQARGK